MKIVGSRQEQAVGLMPSGAALPAGARFNDEIHRLPTGQTTHIPNGVYRFKSHAQANEFDQGCLARHMARIALERERLLQNHDD